MENLQRKTLEEIATEFGLPVKSVQAASFDEGWPIMRHKFLKQHLEESDAGNILAEALASSRAIVAAGEGTAILLLQKAAECLQDLKRETAPSSRSSIVSNVSFAVANTAKALKDMGVIGIAGRIDKEGIAASGNSTRWNPQLLQQINVTIDGLLKSASSAKVDTEPVTVAAESAPSPDDCV